MKKAIPVVLAALIAVLLLFSASAETYVLGDVNGSGKIEVTDARLTLRRSAKIESFDDIQMILGDVNKDGKITPVDARLILRVAAKLDPSFGTIEIGSETTTEATTVNAPETTTAEVPPETTTEKPDEPSTDPEGTVVKYSEFTVDMQAFLSGKFGFTGKMGTPGGASVSDDDMTLKTDGKNTKMTTTFDPGTGSGAFECSILMRNGKTYFISEENKKYMLIKDMVDAMNKLIKDDNGKIDASSFTMGLDNFQFGAVTDDLNSLTAVKTEDGDQVTYKVSIEKLTIDFIYNSGKLTNIKTYDANGVASTEFTIKTFYSKITSSDFSLSPYKEVSNLIMLFPFSITDLF